MASKNIITDSVKAERSFTVHFTKKVLHFQLEILFIGKQLETKAFLRQLVRFPLPKEKQTKTKKYKTYCENFKRTNKVRDSAYNSDRFSLIARGRSNLESKF